MTVLAKIKSKSNQFPFIDWYVASNIPTDSNAFRI